jgi:ATP-dependent helicase HepA
MNVVAGNLVRWASGASGGLGVVVAVDGGRRIQVRFDTGEENLFAWPNDVLERVVFTPGSQIHLLADNEVGVVSNVTEVDGKVFYAVQLPGGVQKTVLEDGVRVAVITDPLQLMRSGTLDSARSVNLRIAATRLLFAHQYDELSSLSNSRVEIKQHQVGVLHRVATSYPHRFLLADEVGLGKTIEAGLILKELKARGMARRTLVLAPSGIVSQWQFELKTKFNETFAQLDKRTIPGLEATHPGENVWALYDNVITSTSYACWTDKRAREIALADWDMVIVDEAHHARRTLGNLMGTRFYRLVQQLANPEHANSRAMLFLTATPMQLHPFELYSLLELLDPTLFASYEDFDDHRRQLAGLNQTVEAIGRWSSLGAPAQTQVADEVRQWLADDRETCATRLGDPDERAVLTEELLARHRLSEALVRNRKAVVGGFMPRVAAVWEVDLTEPEWEAYHAVTQYAREGFERARIEKNNALGFLMVSFQKLVCSSSAALRKSLLKRIEKLEKKLDASSAPPLDEDELEELPVSDGLDDILATRFRESTETEITELRSIVALLNAVSLDSKTRVLIERLSGILASEPNAKVIIFTQYLETQAYIAEHVPAPWTTHIFNGSLKPADKDRSVARFRDEDGPQLLISSEAGGEGRNLQFSHMMVNYDLPWNPMKVEQRIGRIDRIGQKKPVSIFNLSTTGTVEERVLHVLSERIGLFEETVGGLDPILGEVEGDLRKILALADEKASQALADYEQRLESRVSEARAAERRLADLIMDTRSFRQDEVQRLLDQRGLLSNDDLKRFVLGALKELGVAINPHPAIEQVFELRLRGRFGDEFPGIVRDGERRIATLDPATALDHEDVEFLAFGHDVVDALVEYVRQREYPGRASHRRVRTNDVSPQSGWLFVYALEFEGVARSKEALPIFVGLDGKPDDELASWLLDRTMRIKREEWADEAPLPPRDEAFESALGFAETGVIQRLLSRQAELAEANREQLEHERRKLDRFYTYKERAAGEKLAAIKGVYDRLLISDDADDQKILPVWATNLDNAERLGASLANERDRRISELAGREQVGVQHELLAVSYVEITSDPRDEIRDAGLVLPVELLHHVVGLYRETSVEDLVDLRSAVEARMVQLATLAKRHPIDQRGISLAGRVAESLADPASYPPTARSLLAAATRYYLLIEDGDHDLTSSTGFEDDQRVVEAVLLAIARATPAPR